MARTTTAPSREVDDALAPPDPRLARRVATVVAATFLLVGVLGFVPGITRDLGDITFAGHESGAELLGLFQVSVLHNIVHLAFGVAGLLAARKGRTAVLYLLAGGAVYLVLALYGGIVDHDHDANFVPLNTADDWLHLGLGVGMIGLGLLVRQVGAQPLPTAPSDRRPA
ncbi:MAG TPA: DUF4383 domain-containing protein [Iamia sp.]|nr:DUF4383 domain-containing protein [Iamia sp.]